MEVIYNEGAGYDLVDGYRMEPIQSAYYDTYDRAKIFVGEGSLVVMKFKDGWHVIREHNKPVKLSEEGYKFLCDKPAHYLSCYFTEDQMRDNQRVFGSILTKHGL